MLLVIDVGNTNMEFGIYRGEELIGSWADVELTGSRAALLTGRAVTNA